MAGPTPIMQTLLRLTASADAAVEVDRDTVGVRLGRTWRTRVPRASIVRAEMVDRRPVSIGAHGWRGRWLVDTARSGLVRLTMEPAATGRCIGVTHTLSELTVSLDDPAAFLAEIESTSPS